MAVKYTRKSYYDKKEKAWIIYYEDKKGRVIKEDYSYDKKRAELLLEEKNKGKNKKSFKAVTKKDSKLIEKRLFQQDKISKRVDTLLKKSPKKFTEKDLTELSFYSDSNYQKKAVEKKLKKLSKKQQTTIKKSKQKAVEKIILKNLWVTYCHTSTAFFYFGNSNKNKRGLTPHEYIDRTLQNFFFYDHYKKGYLEKPKYERVRVTYQSKEDNENIFTGETFYFLSTAEFEQALTLIISGDEFNWTNEQCNIIIEGLI